MKSIRIMALGWVALAMILVAGAVAQTSIPENKGLRLSVQKDSCPLGSGIELNIEVVPDHISSGDIILGIIRSDNKIFCYTGQSKGFSPFDGFDTARPLVTDFPLNTSMTVVHSVMLPQDWPAGKYQFIACIIKGGRALGTYHSNCFSATKAQ